MKTEDLKSWIKQNLFSKNGRLNIKKMANNGQWIKTNYPEIYQQILSKTSNLKESHASFSTTTIMPEKIYWVLYNITEEVLCKCCKKTPVNFNSFNKGYNIYCSVKCSRYDTEQDRINTNLKRWGVKHPSQNREINNKLRNSLEAVDIKKKEKKKRETNIKVYGVEHPSQNKEVQQKTRKTNKLKWGYEYPQSSPEVKQLQLQTYINKYGCHALSLLETREKIKNTCIKKYGVSHPMQNAEFIEKWEPYKNSWHDYILPSSKEIKLQGYESRAMDELLEQYNEDKILYKRTDMPEFWYHTPDNKIHRYYPDFYIPKDNLIIEVKSIYTYKADLEINLLKEESVKDVGYEYKLVIYD